METRYENWFVYYFNITYYYNDNLNWMQRIAPHKRRPIKKNWLLCSGIKNVQVTGGCTMWVQCIIGSDHDSFGRGSSFLAWGKDEAPISMPLSETGLFIRCVWLVLLITEICMDAYVTKRKDCKWCNGKDVATRRLCRYVRWASWHGICWLGWGKPRKFW